MNRVVACLALWLVSGCSQPMVPGRVDAPVTGDVGLDGRTADVAATPDTADDDADDDGIAQSRDCDDTDAAVGTSGSRSCDGPCGPGVAACIDGAWQACMASTECLCPTNGMTRTMPCGAMCGTRTDTCTDLHWVEGTTCDGEGACEPGAVEMVNGPRCSVSRRACSDECSWGAAEVVTPEGCTPGFINCLDNTICTDACVFERSTRDLCP